MATPPTLEEPKSTDSADRRGSTGYVQSFERGLAVILAFGPDHPLLTLSDVARRAQINRAAARRFLHTLVDLGYVQAEGRHFSLRPKVLELGYAYISSLPLPELALSHLKVAAEAVHESSYLSVLDGEYTFCIAHVPMRRIWNTTTTVGTRLPAFATAAGRVLLAQSDEKARRKLCDALELRQITPYTITDRAALLRELGVIHRQGWAFVEQELEEGLRTVAVPVRDASGAIVAAASMSTIIGTGAPEIARDVLLQPLLSAAVGIENDLRATSRHTL